MDTKAQETALAEGSYISTHEGDSGILTEWSVELSLAKASKASGPSPSAESTDPGHRTLPAHPAVCRRKRMVVSFRWGVKIRESTKGLYKAHNEVVEGDYDLYTRYMHLFL